MGVWLRPVNHHLLRGGGYTAIYKLNGDKITTAYNSSGASLSAAFDISGDKVFPELVVANYNVGGWYTGGGTNVPAEKEESYLAMQKDVLEGVNADILCIEEYWTYFSGTTKAADALLNPIYPYSHSENGTNQYFGRCICSKYPIVDYVVNTFSSEPDRYYDVATINVNGTLIKVFVTHLSVSSPQSRVDQATVIHNYISSNEFDKYLVFGDFNVGVTSPLSEYNLQVFGQFLNDGCALVNGGAFGVFETYSRNSTYSDNLCVDNIIVSDFFTIESASVNMTKVNFQSANGDKIDHIPLIAGLLLTA